MEQHVPHFHKEYVMIGGDGNEYIQSHDYNDDDEFKFIHLSIQLFNVDFVRFGGTI